MAIGEKLMALLKDLSDDDIEEIKSYLSKKADDPDIEDEDDDPPKKVDKSPTKMYLQRLFEQIKDDITPDKWKRAVRNAAGHAGGKRARQKEAYDPYFDDGLVERSVETNYGKLTKSDPRVDYRLAEAPGVECRDCTFYRWGACQIVEGQIAPEGVCDLFNESDPEAVRAADLVTICASEYYNGQLVDGAWRLFVEQSKPFAAAEAPDVITIIPKPGKYEHRDYGNVVMNNKRAERFVDNFKKRVYQNEVPIYIDIEHKSKLSGASGYYKDMWVADDGTVQASIGWTKRGKKLLEDDAFKYFSPEWFDKWTDPVTGETHEDVIIGGAICTRPFFKDKSMPAMVANESGLHVVNRKDTNWPIYEQLQFSEEGNEDMGMSPEELKQFAEMQDTIKQFNDRLNAEKERADNAEAEVKAFKEANEAVTKQMAETLATNAEKDQERRFTDEVMGRSNENDGRRWFGEPEKNVKLLKAIAKSAGEDSEEFKTFIAHQRAMAERIYNDPLLREFGSEGNGNGSGKSETETVKSMAEKRASEKSIDVGEAYSQLFSEDPKLYDRYTKEATQHLKGTSTDS